MAQFFRVFSHPFERVAGTTRGAEILSGPGLNRLSGATREDCGRGTSSLTISSFEMAKSALKMICG
jgi:hypothetical protein